MKKSIVDLEREQRERSPAEREEAVQQIRELIAAMHSLATALEAPRPFQVKAIADLGVATSGLTHEIGALRLNRETRRATLAGHIAAGFLAADDDRDSWEPHNLADSVVRFTDALIKRLDEP